MEPPARRVGVEPGQLIDPRFGFEQGRDPRAQIASHPAHQHTPSGHFRKPYPWVTVFFGLARRTGADAFGCGRRELGGNWALRGFVWVIGRGQGRPEAGGADP